MIAVGGILCSSWILIEFDAKIAWKTKNVILKFNVNLLET